MSAPAHPRRWIAPAVVAGLCVAVLIIAAAALLGAIPLRAFATEITVRGATELQLALKAARGGERIRLAPGDYGPLEIAERRFEPTLTLIAAERHAARFTLVRLEDVHGLRLENLRVANPDNGARFGGLFSILQGSSKIEVVGNRIHGPIDDFYDGWYGIYGRDSVELTVSNNFIHDVRNGGVFFNVHESYISENVFEDLGEDSLKFGGNKGLVIENNTGARRVFPQPGAHLDFIQFQGSGERIVLRGNIHLPELRPNTQGLFLSDAEFHDVTIEQNIIYTGMLRGVTVSAGSNIVVRNNTLLNIPGLVHRGTFILVPDDAVVERNIVSHEKNGRAEGSNIVAQYTQEDAPYYYGDMFTNAEVGLGVELQDLKPVPGGLADYNQRMGAYQRLEELLK